MRSLMDTTLARHTGKSPEQIRKDTDRDKILTAADAKEYGIIDTVLEYRKLSAPNCLTPGARRSSHSDNCGDTPGTRQRVAHPRGTRGAMFRATEESHRRYSLYRSPLTSRSG